MATKKKQEATTSDGKSFVDVGINKTDEILVIVESPNKTSTLTSIFKKLGLGAIEITNSNYYHVVNRSRTEQSV